MLNILTPGKYETFTDDRAVVVSIGPCASPPWIEWSGINNHSIEWLRNWAWKRAGRPEDVIIMIREE